MSSRWPWPARCFRAWIPPSFLNGPVIPFSKLSWKALPKTPRPGFCWTGRKSDVAYGYVDREDGVSALKKDRLAYRNLLADGFTFKAADLK